MIATIVLYIGPTDRLTLQRADVTSLAGEVGE